MIKIEHLRKEYENVTPIEDLSVEIKKGDVISIIGPSGTGKSTLLRCLNQMEMPTAGNVFLDGECITKKGYDITKARQKMGMVFQNFNLFEHKNVIENLMLAPVMILGKSKTEAYEKGMELLKTVGLAKKATSLPSELSGGQKQRVAIARAIAMEPEILLLDEPTSALDPTMVEEVLGVIHMLAKTGMTMLIVTHEMEFAKKVSNRIFYMDEGGIYEEGTPMQIFENPKKPKTIQFIKKQKILEENAKLELFDYYGFLVKLEEYGYRNMLEQKRIQRLGLILEEMVLQSLVNSERADATNLSIRIVYSEAENLLELYIMYDGKKYNIMDKSSLSAKLVAGVASECEYYYDEENIVKIKLD